MRPKLTAPAALLLLSTLALAIGSRAAVAVREAGEEAVGYRADDASVTRLAAAIAMRVRAVAGWRPLIPSERSPEKTRRLVDESNRRNDPPRAAGGAATARTTSPVAGLEPADTVVLQSGVRVALMEARANPMVSSTVAILSGVADEKPDANGAAHMLEHLLFDGTASRSREQIDREVDAIGAYHNASTRDDYTLFQILVHRDHLEKALDLQSDMLFRSTLPEAEFAKERGVVLEEMAREANNPEDAADRFFRRCWYGEGPRARPVLGTRESIEAMRRESVSDQYRRTYRPERMVVLLAGDFDRPRAIAALEKTFGAAGGALSREARTSGFDVPDEPRTSAQSKASGFSEAAGAATQDVRRSAPRKVGADRLNPARSRLTNSPRPSATRDRPGSTGASRSAAMPPAPGLYRQHLEAGRGYLRYAVPAPPPGDPDTPAVEALANLLGSGVGSRLAGALSGPEGSLALESSASYVPGPDGGRLEIRAVLPEDSGGVAAIRAIGGALRALAAEPVEPGALRRVLTSAKADTLYLRDQVHYFGMAVAPDLVLAHTPSLGCAAACLDALTPERIQQAAKRWVMASPVVTLSSPSVAAGAPPGPGAVPPPAAGSTDLAGSGATAAASSPSTAPHGSSRREAQRVDFENGLTMLVSDTPGSEVFAVHVLARDRAALEPAGQDGVTDALHRSLPRGSLFLDAEGLRAKLESLGARLKTIDDPDIPYDDYYSSPRYSFVRFETLRENWREGLGLLFTIVAHPRLAPRDVAEVLAEQIDISRRAVESPAARARAAYAAALLGEHPLARPLAGRPDTLGSLNVDALRTHQARIFAPANLIVSIASSVPASEVIEAARGTFGAMPPGTDAPALPPLKIGKPRSRPSRLADPPETREARTSGVAAGKAQSQILLGRIFARDPADLAPLIVATTVLSRRVAQELRETRGLAYSVSCSLEDFGAKAWFTASMGTRPENVEAGEKGLREAIAGFAGAETPREEIDRAVQSMRGQVAMRRMTRIGQAYALGFNEFLQRPADFDTQIDAALARVTSADIKRVAAKYFLVDRMVSATAR